MIAGRRAGLGTSPNGASWPRQRGKCHSLEWTKVLARTHASAPTASAGWCFCCRPVAAKGCLSRLRLAIEWAAWPPAWSPFAVPLFAEPIAFPNEPFIAARSFTFQHLAIELQALQALFHAGDSA